MNEIANNEILYYASKPKSSDFIKISPTFKYILKCQFDEINYSDSTNIFDDSAELTVNIKFTKICDSRGNT